MFNMHQDDRKRGSSRRAMIARLTGMSALAASGVLLGSVRALAADSRAPIRQPSKADARHFMHRAIVMRDAAAASGDQPYGAVIVQGGRIVGQAPSRVVVGTDPTAHAEMEAIRDAARRLGTRDLSGCEIYASSRPCRMCETAAYWANLSRIHYGAAITDAGAPGYSSC